MEEEEDIKGEKGVDRREGKEEKQMRREQKGKRWMR